MLQNLYVKDLALIEEVDVTFHSGLNILSGETGAGKSIIIGSINLALGGKVPKDIIRKGASYAYIELVFHIENEELRQQLEALDITLEDNQLIIGKKILEGRSISRINGESVPSSKIKEIAGFLLDLHGQHEHQSLLYPTKHLQILDLYGKNQIKEKKKQVNEKYKEYMEIKRELSFYEIDEERQRRELSFLEYEINEIESANIMLGEEERLMEEYRKLFHSKQIYDGLQEASNYITHETYGMYNSINNLLHSIQKIQEFDEQLSKVSEQILDVESIVTDVSREISRQLSMITMDEHQLLEIQERLELLHKLQKKYGDTEEKILLYLEQKKEEYEKLLHFEEKKEALQKKYKQIENELEDCCIQLSIERKEVSKELIAIMKESLIHLNFLDVQLDMEFKQLDQYTSNGFDFVEFVISTNPGEPLQPLSKVASGGELSRIMLAIKTVLADADQIPTLIFDEIDTGISGRTAQLVSEKLSIIGKSRQVICISHLPQIVAMADSHYLISKSVVDSKTKTEIVPLNEEEIINEIARLLGGSEITQNTLASAKEMKEFGNSYKM